MQNKHKIISKIIGLTLLIMIWQCKPHVKHEQVNYTNFAQQNEQAN